ncbi:hypothetical protein FOPG_15073 [Fusarium oxysporum f. sp. conglutinans race 2 54008]|uniref:Uncharacterized protein n=1 Tax=Fusarium oxysporum f. sp. conglutinans race 2 54008 TaxID=1089457 RepID=X0I6H9_FUSOX|nr:hypothetical protein FOPG_15073 [Fusarium oxysporum f. sp. conglutinans race 2 54008]KAI8407751.1 hypothetical protein FOFC_13192 [Fusarium oxysporum]
MHVSKVGVTGLVAMTGMVTSSYVDSLSENAKELLTVNMEWTNTSYDRNAGYLYDFSGAGALGHENRSSAWYAFGLLARNNGKDVTEAEKIIETGSDAYRDIDNYWDPDWRGFTGTTLIMALEEFPKLISKSVQQLLLESLHNATKGDEYRFGNLDPNKDNLYPAHSNPISEEKCPAWN